MADISGTLLVGSPQNFAWLGVWPIDISAPTLVNFDYGVRRCHAATCISPSLMHLLVLSFTFVQVFVRHDELLRD